MTSLGATYRELYEEHQSLKAGNAATNRVVRRLHAELMEERARSRRQLRYILRLRKWLRKEHGMTVNQIPFDLKEV